MRVSPARVHDNVSSCDPVITNHIVTQRRVGGREWDGLASFGVDVVSVKEINARGRLREAGYFLDGMKRFEKEGLADEFIYHFDGFLVAWHSIHDNTILYDFAEEFKLPFTRKDKMTYNEFDLAAKWLERENASVFLKWLRSEVCRLRAEYKVLFELRHQVVHRSGRIVEKATRYRQTTYGFVSTPGVSAITFGAWLGTSGEVQAAEARWYGSKANEMPVLTPSATRPTPAPEAIIRYPEAENLFYFSQADDPKGRRVVDVCESAYRDVDKMLTEAQIGAWKKER